MAKNTQIQIRTTDEVKDKITKKATDAGFSNLTEYMLFVALNTEIKVSVRNGKNSE